MRRIISPISRPRHNPIWLMHDALSQTMSEIQTNNMQRDPLFDDLKSIKCNSDSEELMVNGRPSVYIIWVHWSVLWSVLSDKEGELGNNEASATGNNCIAIAVSKKTKIVSICFYKSIIILCDQLLSVRAVSCVPTSLSLPLSTLVL